MAGDLKHQAAKSHHDYAQNRDCDNNLYEREAAVVGGGSTGHW